MGACARGLGRRGVTGLSRNQLYFGGPWDQTAVPEESVVKSDLNTSKQALNVSSGTQSSHSRSQMRSSKPLGPDERGCTDQKAPSYTHTPNPPERGGGGDWSAKVGGVRKGKSLRGIL